MSATSSGLGSSPPESTEAAPRRVDDDDVEDESGLQTKKLVSACNNAVRRLSSPTNDTDDHIELDGLARQNHDLVLDDVEEPSTSPR